MAKSGKVLSIDITNESITIIEITASQKKQTNVHNVIIFETPEDSYEDGMIKAPDRIAYAIREQLSSRGITNKNVIFVLSSTKIVNREVVIPYYSNAKKIGDVINNNSSDYFPVNIEDYSVSHTVLETVEEAGTKQLRVLAVAAPFNIIKSYHELANVAGLNIVDIDYIGNAMLELIKTQTVADTTTMVVQLGSEATVLNIVQGENLLLQRTVPYGTNSVVNVVMDEKNVDATTAMTLLQNEKLITVDFSDNEATGAFKYLINNIGRVMDYYASKNPTRPIEDICLTGDGALIKGIDGLFKIQLNINTKIMDNLINIKFDPSIDLKVYNPVYLVTPIGAAFNPMGFDLFASKKSKASSGNNENIGLAVAAVVFVGCLIGAAGFAFSSIKGLEDAENEKAAVEADIARLQPIQQVIEERDASIGIKNDAINMSATTYNRNENVRSFISQFEEKIPQDVTILGFESSADGMSIPAYSYSYDALADFVLQIKTIDCVDDVYIDGWVKEEENGQTIYKFNYNAVFVDNNKYIVDEVVEETSEETTEEATEEATE